MKTIVDTELGERITISYLVENEENRLVFVGDKDLNFLFIGYLSNENNQQKLVEYLDDRVTTMNVPPIPRHIDPNCASYYCSKTENSYYYNPQPGCSFVVGQACSPLLIAPVPGARILFLLCKAGVFVGCNVAKEKVCVQGTWFPVCER